MIKVEIEALRLRALSPYLIHSVRIHATLAPKKRTVYSSGMSTKSNVFLESLKNLIVLDEETQKELRTRFVRYTIEHHDGEFLNDATPEHRRAIISEMINRHFEPFWIENAELTSAIDLDQKSAILKLVHWDILGLGALEPLLENHNWDEFRLIGEDLYVTFTNSNNEVSEVVRYPIPFFSARNLYEVLEKMIQEVSGALNEQFPVERRTWRDYRLEVAIPPVTSPQTIWFRLIPGRSLRSDYVFANVFLV